MLTVRLHGHLEESYGSEFKFEARTVREVVDALQANFNDFTEEFIKDERAYTIVVDAEAQELAGCVLPLKSDSTIDIVPAIVGAGGIFKALALIVVGTILVVATGGAALGVAGATLAGSAGTLATVGYGIGAGLTAALGATTAGILVAAVGAIGAGLLLSGVASLLAGPDGPDGAGEKASSLSRTDNVVGQGLPIPVGYGRLMIGSVVLSASFVSSFSKVVSAYTYKTGGVWVDNHLVFGQQQDVTAIEQNAAEDGHTLTLTYANNSSPLQSNGYTPEEWTAITSYWDSGAAGSGVYTMTNTVNSSGITIPVTKFVATTNATAISDSTINKRSSP
jgi:predicted phage tail protein